MLIIGHRGASYDAPENTLASIALAWTQNADAAEVDVFLSKDEEIVVIHDETTKRVGGPDRPVAEQTLAELRVVDVGRWKGQQWAGERIPTLSDVLAALPDGKVLFVEVKCGPEIIPRLVPLLKAARKRPEQTCVISFSYDVLSRLKRALPAIRCFGIVELNEKGQSDRRSPLADTLIRDARDAGLDGIDLEDSPVIDGDLVSKVKHSGLEVYVWTVDSTVEAERLWRVGVDGIATNRPGHLKEYFRKLA